MNYREKHSLNRFLFGHLGIKKETLFNNLPELIKYMSETSGHKYFDHPVGTLKSLIWEQLVGDRRPIYNHYKSYRVAVEAKLKTENRDSMYIEICLENFDRAFRDYAFEQMKKRE